MRSNGRVGSGGFSVEEVKSRRFGAVVLGAMCQGGRGCQMQTADR